jgi:hypothetical protein
MVTTLRLKLRSQVSMLSSSLPDTARSTSFVNRLAELTADGPIFSRNKPRPAQVEGGQPDIQADRRLEHRSRGIRGERRRDVQVRVHRVGPCL